MKINFVVSGNYLGCKILQSKHGLYIKTSNSNDIFLSKSTMENFEVIYRTNAKINKQRYSVIIYFKDGKKSLLEIDEKIYNAILKNFL